MILLRGTFDILHFGDVGGSVDLNVLYLGNTFFFVVVWVLFTDKVNALISGVKLDESQVFVSVGGGISEISRKIPIAPPRASLTSRYVRDSMF